MVRTLAAGVKVALRHDSYFGGFRRFLTEGNTSNFRPISHPFRIEGKTKLQVFIDPTFEKHAFGLQEGFEGALLIAIKQDLK
ncbi:MAG TPA: hypothetical protein DCZ69_06935 [Syntrophobacteraceae bacterium]|nr:hypothetical protein [Syntrophobacteraceae bacterium]HBZ56432.1 hypothetical protein [Syntrophobacteraceae bacterium]